MSPTRSARMWKPHTRICDDIETRVLDLAARLRSAESFPQGGK